MDSKSGVARLQDIVHHLRKFIRQHATVGIAERNYIGARFGGNANYFDCICAIRAVTVEEMLGS
jgi:hypothetical protein